MLLYLLSCLSQPLAAVSTQTFKNVFIFLHFLFKNFPLMLFYALSRECVVCRTGLYHDSPEMMQLALQRSLMHDIGPAAVHDVRSPAMATRPPPAHRSPGRHASLVTRPPPPAHFHPLPIYSPS